MNSIFPSDAHKTCKYTFSLLHIISNAFFFSPFDLYELKCQQNKYSYLITCSSFLSESQQLLIMAWSLHGGWDIRLCVCVCVCVYIYIYIQAASRAVHNLICVCWFGYKEFSEICNMCYTSVFLCFLS